MRGLHTHTPILILYFHTHSDKQRHTHDLNPSDMPVLYSLALYYSHLPWEDHWRFKLSCYHAYSIPSLSLCRSLFLLSRPTETTKVARGGDKILRFLIEKGAWGINWLTSPWTSHWSWEHFGPNKNPIKSLLCKFLPVPLRPLFLILLSVYYVRLTWCVCVCMCMFTNFASLSSSYAVH